MGKKTLWKDNTMPPTNYLWLKIGQDGEVVGLYEHNGHRWIKIADGEHVGSSLTFIDLDGVEHTISNLSARSDGVVQIGIIDGPTISNLITVDYATNNLLAKDDPNLVTIVQEAVNNSLYDQEVDEQGQPVYVLKSDIIQQIVERVNYWMED